MACQQATRGYPPEIVDSKGKFCLDGIQMEVDGEGNATGKFRDTKRRTPMAKPGGEWPEHCGDYTHEFDGHGVDAGPDDRQADDLLSAELMSLYVQNGVEMLAEDVSGANLDPAAMQKARGVEMDYFKGMSLRPCTQVTAVGGQGLDYWDQVDRCEQGRL